VLPSEIQQRPGKTNFFPLFQKGLRSLSVEDLTTRFLQHRENYEPYIDNIAFRDLYRRTLGDDSQNLPQDWLTLWRVISVVAYLNRQQSVNVFRKEVVTM
jgi:hypothetical protein